MIFRPLPSKYMYMNNFYYLYKITNLINKKYYIGVHSTNNLDDGYMGSGKLILKAIEKYGNKNFKKEILEWFNTEEEMYKKEIEIVNEEFVNDKTNYNVKLGGPANFYYVNKNKLNHKKNQHLIHANKLKSDPEYRKRFVEKMKNALSKEKRLEYSKRMKENNCNRNRFWISNDFYKKSKMVTQEQFDVLLNQNWYKGVKYRKNRYSNPT